MKESFQVGQECLLIINEHTIRSPFQNESTIKFNLIIYSLKYNIALAIKRREQAICFPKLNFEKNLSHPIYYCIKDN